MTDATETNSQRTLRVATRGSKLARTQAGHIRDALIDAGYPAELTIVTTAGDLSQAPVERIGVGVFTTAIRQSVFNNEADIAVHSFKDLPTAAEPRTHLVIPVREDRREALIARDGMTLAELPVGARVGTSAPRRISQLKAIRPDLDIRPLRGNIDSRMGRVTDGELDAVVLAFAGLTRVGLGAKATQVFDPNEFMPAPAQGALAVECRADDGYARQAVDKLVSADDTTCAMAERTVLAVLEAGCTAPVASTATIDGGRITLRGGVFAPDGSAQLVEEAAGTDPVELGNEVAEKLFAGGAARFL
ncbi:MULTISPECIES: hydroxymethylbilane synthase [unclassified Corynebacterium]|uniref:hydroxymethylbilane synthase n=1 Tax=unclassified Corynebacterium TaxID=2624378 RepID=UPI00265308B9|nr:MULTISPECIES: hydroxymethylbilane synthase [unclassified Corynebacterium]MDN8594092.1 hydroxymethylbilane synthase [Corynebacterium sp. P4_F2]WKK54975.1 hydroxymethylbilane synthase [Corynebacterium sp. P4-C1]WKK62388.1 hydroxymethylbilane synthase [Corynebacterium sp. P8-C1]